MNPESTRCWIAFNLVKGIGAARLRQLIQYFGNPCSAWSATPAELAEAGLPPRLVEAVVQGQASNALDRAWQTIEAQGIRVLTWESPEYPRRLAEADGPPVLYLHGEITPADVWAVAVVGTRRATAYGRQAAEELAAGLARHGVTVVSGLARGIDAIAHQAALHAGGRTLAVLGSGIDRIYPPEHARLAAEICLHGAVVSDYPPGTEPDAANFPPRNRIISGLSQAVIVVEAGEKSGALITSGFAYEQNRPVFAVPGSIFAVQSKGTNRLIRDGAHIYTGVQDVLDLLQLGRVQEYHQARMQLPENAEEAQVYSVLGSEPIHVDEIRNRSGLPIEQVSSTLTLMELKGMVRQVGGMNYVAVREQPADYRV